MNNNKKQDIVKELVRLIHRTERYSAPGVYLDADGHLQADLEANQGYKLPSMGIIDFEAKSKRWNVEKSEINDDVIRRAEEIYQHIVDIHNAKIIIIKIENAYQTLDLDWTTQEERALAIASLTEIPVYCKDYAGNFVSAYKVGQTTIKVLDNVLHGVGCNSLEITDYVYFGDMMVTNYTPLTGSYTFGPQPCKKIHFNALDAYFFVK